MTTQVATKACSACTYWKTTAANEGECRRHAPQTLIFKVDGDVEYRSKFPITSGSDWCGDFYAK
jgi:hypothetical protein